MSLVIKRNKKAQEFSEKKLKRSIQRAFESCKHKIEDQDLNLIISDVNVIDGIRTEDIQKQVENILMRRGHYDEARFYIIWRHINYYDNYLGNKVKFMREYLGAVNAASGSKFDSNANVTEKNVATLSNELFKGDVIKLNRYRLHDKIAEMYGRDLADKYIRELESHRLYKHDESSIMPYCVAVTMYRYLMNGLIGVGGLSKAPQNLDSYCGGFINLAFAISAQFAGAFASPEFLMYFDYFARKAFGQDYMSHSDEFYVIGPKLRKLLNSSHYWCRNPKELSDHDFGSAELNKIRDEIVRDSTRGLTEQELMKYKEEVVTDPSYKIVLGDGTRTISSQIEQYFQQVVYSMNQPAAARGYQSIFWNIGYFDKYYFEGLFGEFQFPDHSTPKWNSLKWLQKKFMYWFNEERRKCVLTFPRIFMGK